MLPACLHLLMRRLEAHDRKRLTLAAKVEAALWNVHRGKESWEKHPEPYPPKYFLPESAEDKLRRLRVEAREAEIKPEDIAKSPEFLAWKQSLLATRGQQPPHGS